MILVTGATGHLGTAVIEQLLKKTSANKIAALVRDESKASDLWEKGVKICLGNYDDVDSLDEAMLGIEKVLLIAGTDEENRIRQHQNVVNAAKNSGVKFIGYTSRNLKDRKTLVNKLMEGHFQTEDYIIESGLNYAIFRNVLYMDTIPQFVGGEKVFETGINLPAGEGKVSYALRSEMGEAIANVLLEDDENKIYQFTGNEQYSFDDVAAALTELSGKTVNYTPVEKSKFESQMKERGTPEAVIQKVVGFITDIKNGQEDEVTFDLENQLGRKPATLTEGLKTLFKGELQ
jgi:NAD(P)H dehydrogenase (quinone)